MSTIDIFSVSIVVAVTTAGKGLLDHLTRLAARAALFQKNIKKAEGHLRRLGNENEKERSEAI